MSSITLLHNPRCSKSRQALALLQEKGIEPEVVEYLKTPLDKNELKALFAKLGLTSVTEMMRTKEAEFREAGLDSPDTTDEDRFAAMATFPKLMERPVAIRGNSARIGRPPENILELL
ncbi:arsenate reductase (glutaredoxin) [Alteromonas sp. CYL-A6]|uniref:arsenate reductase (glutaredoxin) n=1 Tax=Alteromonas nitratireducens TaxID=3390813 RepID=UPI0034AFAA80